MTLLLACEQQRQASPDARSRFEQVIPRPVSVEVTGHSFVLTNDTRIVADDRQGEVADVAHYLAEILRPATGYPFEISSGASRKAIALSLVQDEELGQEGYVVDIDANGVNIRANTGAGLFWGVQTLRQLLPAAVESDTVHAVEWEIATGRIRDYPQYPWRGSMLDVSRHFFGIEDVKRYIDLITLYKMNVLHLHLSDDQGWRIEIDSWPNLAKIGGASQVGGGEGGYFTKAQYREIVNYASSHFVTIVPEIDMPGHINAALVSYKELLPGPPIRREPASAPPDRPTPGVPYTGIQVGFSTLDIKKPVTFQFIEDVWREIAAMTPGPYLHVGGDEAAVTKKPDYIAFVNRFRAIVSSNGKQMIGWEEIAQADIDSTVVVQYWNSPKYARMAAEKGAKLIFSPAQKVYLDMQYDSTTRLGLHWAGYLEVDSSYMWDPATRAEGVDPRQILGVEAPLWSETLETIDDIEYMLFPRLPGVAEVGWTPASRRQWEEYRVRLAAHARRWEVLGVDYYKSPRVPWREVPTN